MLKLRTAFRIAVVLLLSWHALLWLFGVVFPYCYSGSLEGTEAACYFGVEDYGQLYYSNKMFSLVILGPVTLLAVGLLASFEVVSRKNVDAA